MAGITHNPPGRRGAASASREAQERAFISHINDSSEVNAFILDVTGPAGTDITDNYNSTGCWFRVSLENGSECTVRSDHDYGLLRSMYGSNDNIRGKYCLIKYSGSGIEDIASGFATICTHGKTMHEDEDVTCSVFSLSAMSGILQEDATSNQKVGQFSNVDGESA